MLLTFMMIILQLYLKQNITPKQILQRLPIALAQVKAGNNSENLLNEMRKIAYSLYKSR